MRLTQFTALAMFALVPTTARAQETIDNSEFTSWSKFKGGASVTLKSTIDSGKMTLESLVTTTLVEVGADKLVLETTAVSKVNGMEFKAPAMKREVPKTITLPKLEKKDEPKVDRPKVDKPMTEEGTETLKVSGTDVKAKWYKTTFEIMGTRTESKNWTSDEIPGGLVKSVTKSSGESPSSITMEVVEFKKP